MKEVMEQVASMLWNPIETAPTDGTRLLLLDDAGVQIVGRWFFGDRPFGPREGWYLASIWPDEPMDDGLMHAESGPWEFHPTYWMALPNIPRG